MTNIGDSVFGKLVLRFFVFYCLFLLLFCFVFTNEVKKLMSKTNRIPRPMYYSQLLTTTPGWWILICISYSPPYFTPPPIFYLLRQNLRILSFVVPSPQSSPPWGLPSGPNSLRKAELKTQLRGFQLVKSTGNLSKLCFYFKENGAFWLYKNEGQSY